MPKQKHQQRVSIFKAFRTASDAQWLSYARDGGVLSETRGGGLSVAFSRDQMLKVYVTHKIKDQGRKVWQLLQVCSPAGLDS